MGYRLLQEAHAVLRTRMGAAFPGTRAVFRGHDLHHDLRDLDWMALYLFGITGRQHTPEQIRMLHAIWVYTSYPDARLWNNRVAALAGSVRSTPPLAMAAALAVSEAQVYGGQAGVRAMSFFLRTKAAVDAGADLVEWVNAEAEQRHILGYGRPIDSTDERIYWLHQRAQALGLAEGPYLRLAFQVEQILLARRPHLRMNNAAYTAALCADMGMDVGEFHLFRVPLFLAGMPPCYVEARERPEATLLPLSCSDIHYEGVTARRW